MSSLRSSLSRATASPLLPPILFAVFPVVFFWAQNVRGAFQVRTVLAVLGIIFVGTFCVYGIVRLLTRSPKKAGLVTTAILVLFFSFGHVAFRLEVGPNTLEETGLLVAWLFLGSAVVMVALSRGNAASPTFFRTVSLVAGALIVFNVVTIVRDSPTPVPVTAIVPFETDGWLASGSERDVYYLVFDRYANEHTFAEQYGFDNLPFLSALEDDGFYVVHDALANYPQTTHSLASTLNMTHLQDLAAEVGTDSTDARPLYRSLKGFAVAQAFKDLGYRYAHIGTWWPQTANDPMADVDYTFGTYGEFSHVFAQTTMLPSLASRVGIDRYDFRHQEWERHDYEFDSLREVASEPATTFTFAHFTFPHPPYVRDRNGNFVPSPDERPIDQAYVEQVQAVNGMILDLVNELLAGPQAQDPIVIIQSDEGPYPAEVEAKGLHIELPKEPDEVLHRKLRILNAYYFPGMDPQDAGLYPEVTPVNTFRILFNAYFDAGLPLLEDTTYVFADDDHPFRFTEVTDRVRVTST